VLDLFGSAAQGLVTTGSGNTVTFSNLNWTTVQKGVGRLATAQEVQGGTVTNAVITPSSVFYLLNTLSFIEDGNTTATPLNGVLDLFGSAAQGLVTTGSGNTVTFSNLSWTTSQKGVGRLSTSQEVIGGTSTTTVITPADLTTRGVLVWQTITVGTNLVANNGYVCQGTASILVTTLPTTAAQYSLIELLNNGSTASGFQIAQNANQIIKFGDLSSTTGSGSIVTNAQGDAIRLICTQANTVWNVLSSMGNFTIN